MRPLPLLACALLAAGCYSNQASNSPGDPPFDAGPPGQSGRALGSGSRIHELVAPGPNHPAPNVPVDFTGASLIIVDQYDETQDGKSVGDVYVQDLGGQNVPYSGLDLYKPSYNPAGLILSPGDVVDVTGPYTDWTGPTSLAGGGFGCEWDPKCPLTSGESIPQMYEPIVSFRFEYKVPKPTLIDATDLGSPISQTQFEKGHRWLSMLVEVDDVTITGYNNEFTPPTTGRANMYFTNDTSLNGPTISNALFPLDETQFPIGTKLKKVIGVVEFFYSFQIAPRSAADLVR